MNKSKNVNKNKIENKSDFMNEEITINRTNTPKNKNSKHKKIMERKKNTSHLNLIISISIFILMSILALYIILNKGNIGNYSLIKINSSVHTAELECDSYFLSTIDSEKTDVSLTIDGIVKPDGFVLRSSNEKIAKIEGNSVVAGEQEGTTTITAYYEAYDMNISTDILTYIPINTITATVSSSVINVGKKAELKISIVPRDGTDEYITYSSSDASIVTVDENGVITGVSQGTTTITIKDELTGASATKNITVK